MKTIKLTCVNEHVCGLSNFYLFGSSDIIGLQDRRQNGVEVYHSSILYLAGGAQIKVMETVEEILKMIEDF